MFVIIICGKISLFIIFLYICSFYFFKWKEITWKSKKRNETGERKGNTEGEKFLLGNGGEDAEPSPELLDGPSSFEPAVPFLLLGFEELITEVFPLLWSESAQDPDVVQKSQGEGNVSKKGLKSYFIIIVVFVVVIKW